MSHQRLLVLALLVTSAGTAIAQPPEEAASGGHRRAMNFRRPRAVRQVSRCRHRLRSRLRHRSTPSSHLHFRRKHLPHRRTVARGTSRTRSSSSAASRGPPRSGRPSPTSTTSPITARLGWYLTDPQAPGAASVLFDYSTDIVTDGFGHFVTGPSLVFRYERRPDRTVVPYVQAGVGLAFNDAYRDQTQRAIGAFTEFYDQVGGGAHFRFAPNWSFDAEVLLQHFSNAGTASRNCGVTNVGFLAGFTYTLGGR